MVRIATRNAICACAIAITFMALKRGGIQKSETNYFQISNIRLATHGRSMQTCQKRSSASLATPMIPARLIDGWADDFDQIGTRYALARLS